VILNFIGTIFFSKFKGYFNLVNYLSMKRREMFSTLGVGLMTTLSLPAWANGWTAQKLPKHALSLNLIQSSVLEDLSETILPETDSPGAKTLEIPKFIETMVADMYTPADQKRFKDSLLKVEDISKLLYGKPYLECSKEQKLNLLQGLNISSDKDQKWFFDTTKGLTIRAYTSSEYYLTEVAKFEFAPGRYYGCVPLNS
jgi:hypothetical protein